LSSFWQSHVRKFYTWQSAFYARWPFRKSPGPQFWQDYQMANRNPDEVTTVDWGLGGTLAVRKELLQNDGKLFDERFFLYFEDVDLCYSAWKRGWQVIVHPDAVLIHEHKRESKSLFSKTALYHLASFFKFFLKHLGLPKRP